MCWVCISSILVASSCLMDSGWLYDCLFESFTQDWLWTYSHDTENTFIDTKNIHYDTVKRYNNYTEKEITELKQHHYVIFYLFVCPRFLLSSSPNVSGVMGSVNPWSAPGRESRVPPALLTGGWGGHGFLSKRTTEKLRHCWPASSVGDKMWRTHFISQVSWWCHWQPLENKTKQNSRSKITDGNNPQCKEQLGRIG